MRPVCIGGIWVDLDELYSRIDLRELVGEDAIPCLWHKESIPSLHIYPDHAFCFGCHTWAGPIRFVKEYFGLTSSQAVNYLLAHRGIKREPRKAAPVSSAIVDGYSQVLNNLTESSLAWSYLKARGIDRGIAKALSLGWDGANFRYSIPHFVNGKVENIKFRYHPVINHPNKYDSLGGRSFSKLYPWDYFRKKYLNHDVLFLTEGELDAMILLQENVPTLSSPSGANADLTKWAIFLKQYHYVFILYDMDDTGVGVGKNLFTKIDSLGRTLEEHIRPANLIRMCWPQEWGKDITDAQDILVPIIKEVAIEAIRDERPIANWGLGRYVVDSGVRGLLLGNYKL